MNFILDFLNSAHRSQDRTTSNPYIYTLLISVAGIFYFMTTLSYTPQEQNLYNACALFSKIPIIIAIYFVLFQVISVIFHFWAGLIVDYYFPKSLIENIENIEDVKLLIKQMNFNPCMQAVHPATYVAWFGMFSQDSLQLMRLFNV